MELQPTQHGLGHDYTVPVVVKALFLLPAQKQSFENILRYFLITDSVCLHNIRFICRILQEMFIFKLFSWI